MIRIRKLDIYFFKKTTIKSNTLRKCKIRIFQLGVLRLTNAPPTPPALEGVHRSERLQVRVPRRERLQVGVPRRERLQVRGRRHRDA